MNVFELTGALIDIESITNNEEAVGNYLYDYLAPLATRYGGGIERMEGEPTENKLALGSKGALRYEVAASGKMAHSAYPELGESAIHKLLDTLDAIRRIPLPTDKLLGPSTLNVGTLSGGRAPNVVADEAKAEIMIRLVGDSTEIKAALARAADGRVELREVIEIPAVQLGAVNGIPTTVVAF